MLLIRHGQSEFNVVYSVTRVDPGIRDPRLTADGRAQALEAARLIGAQRPTRLVTSPYTRALETAEIVAEELGLPITVDPRVGERAAFACDVGTPISTLRQRWMSLALDHLDELWWPELEESEEALGLRCEAFRSEIAQAEDWRHVAVVTHWGFIRGLTGMTVPNCAVLRVDPTQPRLSPETLSMPPAAGPARPMPTQG
jgi:broad specificity phosphatase PhoE